MKRVLAILALIAFMFFLGWAFIVLAEGIIGFLRDELPQLWKGFLEAVRQFGEACRGHKPS